MAKILVTGGAGYIGSHTCVELLLAGYEVVVLDNLSNSSAESLKRVEKITGKSLVFIEGDIRNFEQLNELFKTHSIDAVINFAGLKSVGESQSLPLEYFDDNIGGTLTLLQAMEKTGVYSFIFSSSATVYATTNISPLKEEMPTGSPFNNYGYSKWIMEELLQRVSLANKKWSIALLRYFNPVGAHPSGEIGEDPQGIPNNLMPFMTQVAVGQREKLFVFGDDYDTVDGTGVRDYIHVVDLAKAHLNALENRIKTQGCRAWNIGTGNGTSVLGLKDYFEKINKVKIPFEIVKRRAGDVATAYADNARAQKELNWKPLFDIEDMLIDSWNWQKKNPQGYK